MQLRSRFPYLSTVLDKTPDEVTKRQLYASEINLQEALSPQATSLDSGLAKTPKLVENRSIKKMSNPRNIYAKITAIVGLVLLIASGAFAKRHSDPAFSNIKIRNFGKMDDRFFRGAQPDESDYKDLKALGINTVIDLQDSPTSYEKRAVEALGMRYVNIPMSDSSYPKEATIQSFFKVVNDPTTGKFFAHCAGGR